MALHKHDIPILEYDDSPHSVIMPTHQNLEFILPEKLIYAFLGEVTDNYAKKQGLLPIAHFVSETKLYPIYVTEYNGEQIGICQAPVGAAAAAQILDWLIGYGAKKVLATGCCGALTDLPENMFLVPTKALRDEGTSYHYLPPTRYAEISPKALTAIERGMNKLQLPYMECITWTTDGFYRETAELVEYRREEGCSVVEMECSALVACAQLRGAEFGQILFTADTLVNTEAYDERSWGEESHEKALYICLDVIGEM